MLGAAQAIAAEFRELGLQSAGQENSYLAQRKRSFARLEAVPRLEIEDGGTVVFERGGKHLMLMRPVDDLDAYHAELEALGVAHG